MAPLELIESMKQRLEQERQAPSTIDPARYMLLCKRAGLVAEIQTLDELDFWICADGWGLQQEDQLQAQIQKQIRKLNRQIISINRKLKIY